MTISELCPCGSNKNYQHCCYRFHSKELFASTPEELMRSRYSAFVLKEFQYLMDTHADEYTDSRSIEELSKPPLPNWLALDVIDSTQKQNTGTVTFIAWYKLEGKLDAIHEKSNFVKTKDHWFYTDGEHLTVRIPKRNDLCVCHSGKKFKKCCGARSD